MQAENNLQTLVTNLEAQDKQKQDYIVTPGSGNLVFMGGDLVLTKEATNITYKPTDHFHMLTADKLKIPSGYYNRLRREAVSLLDDNVNHWLKKSEGNFMLRTFEGDNNVARAILSDRYSVMDNMDVLLQTLDAVRASGVNVEIKQAEITDTRMYLSIVCPDVEIQAKEMLEKYAKTLQVGHGVCAGFTLANSEVGAGAFNIRPRAVILACNNGMVRTEDGLKKIHLGARMESTGALNMEANKDVRKANLNLIKQQVKHAVQVFLSKDYLQKTIDWYTNLGNKEIQAPVQNVLAVIGKEYDFTEQRKSSILNYFIKGADTRRIGMFNAITEELQSEGYNGDLRYDTETIAQQVLVNFDKFERQAGNIARLSDN